MPQSLQDLSAKWNDLASPNPQGSNGALRNVVPQSLVSDSPTYNPTAEKHIGILPLLKSEKGLPAGYSPTVGESLAFGVTQFARNLVSSGAQLFFPKFYSGLQKRQADLAVANPEAAADFASRFGDLNDTKPEAVRKFVGSAAEAALNVVPAAWLEKLPFAGLKAANLARETIVAGKAVKAGEVALEAGQVAKTFTQAAETTKALSGAQKFIRNYGQMLATGGAYGAAQGFSSGLQTDDADWQEILKQTAIGAGIGSAVGLGIPLVLQGTGAAIGKITSTARAGAEGLSVAGNKVKGVVQKVLPSGWIADKIPVSWYKNFFSGDATLAEYFGDIGKNFTHMYEHASQSAAQEIRGFVGGMIERGLVKPPSLANKAFKGVEFVGDNKEMMSYYNRVLRGVGEFGNRTVQQAAIDADPRLSYLDQMRKWYASRSTETGTNLLDINTYLPKHTPVIDLSRANERALLKTDNQFEREAIYQANNPIVADMVENSLDAGFFTKAEDAYKTYYDYVKLVNEGSHLNLTDNKFLQHMVKTGQATTIEEAYGKVVQDLKYRQSSLTPRAASLDFKREVNLPWYDPNPARVMPAYALDASSRIALSQQFGKNDEVIKEMIGKIKGYAAGQGKQGVTAAKDFEGLVRHIMNQTPKNRDAEAWSSWFRSLQTVKLSFAQVMNLGQSLNYLLPTDSQALWHGVKQVFTQDGLRSAVKRGVLMNSMMHDLLTYTGGGTQFAENVLKYSGFTGSEMINRAVGSGTAENFYTRVFKNLLAEKGIVIPAEQQAKVTKMIADKRAFEEKVAARMAEVQRTAKSVGQAIEFKPDLKEIALEQITKEFPEGLAYDKFITDNKRSLIETANIKRTQTATKGANKGSNLSELLLREIGIDPEEAVARGFLTEDDLGTAAENLVKNTQFLSRNIDLPVFTNSPFGKVLFQFKNFAYMQAKFLKRQFATDLGRGDYKKALRNIVILGAVFPMTGEVLADVRALVTGEKRPTPGLDRYISNLANAGAYGLFYDFLNQAVQGDATSFVAGPTFSDASKYLQGLGNVATGNFETGGSELLKQAARQTGVGRAAVNRIAPSSSQPGQTIYEDLQDWFDK